MVFFTATIRNIKDTTTNKYQSNYSLPITEWKLIKIKLKQLINQNQLDVKQPIKNIHRWKPLADINALTG